MQPESSYRPHDLGNDYYDRGIYHITLVVNGREALLPSQMEEASAIAHGQLSHLNMDARNPGVVLTPLGAAVKEEWEKIPSFENKKGRHVKLHAFVCMPDHIHGVIEVEERMDVSVGRVIWGFKTACTKRWRALAQPTMAADYEQPRIIEPGIIQPSLAEQGWIRDHGLPIDDRGIFNLQRLSRRQRREYYDHLSAMGLRTATPLFDDNYDDTICLRMEDGSYNQRHLSAMVNYVNDNPRRAIMRKLHPEFMKRQLHIRIGTGKVGADGVPEWRDYAAFGNLFLLRWAWKVQVFCHRKAPNGMPYEKTEMYRAECREWKRMVMEGATVIVTPGISMGERIIKDRCIESGYPLIHIQKEPIGRYWKPEASRLSACENGTLLILAPWKPDTIGEVNGVPQETDYSIFHNLNKVAEEITNISTSEIMKIQI